MSKSQYIGRAGEFAVMSELAWRGYNVATPEIDEGDDIFAVNQDNGNMWRIQVKTSDYLQQQKSKRYQFKIKKDSYINAPYPDRTFIFVMRDEEIWRFLNIERSVLKNYIDAKTLGKHAGEFQQISLVVDNNLKVMGAKAANFSHHLEDWSKWPELN